MRGSRDWEGLCTRSATPHSSLHPSPSLYPMMMTIRLEGVARGGMAGTEQGGGSGRRRERLQA
eukprot:2341395-Rhodomonas_salina.1